MKYKNNYWGLPLIMLVIIIATFPCCRSNWIIESPYDKINWKECDQYKANFHTHTMVSDGWMNPQTVVEKYHEKGYRILAITDHNFVTYPWNEFSKFEASDKTKRRVAAKELKPEEEELILPEDMEFKNVDPSKFGMIPIQGNELSSHHHMGSYFNDHNGTTTETESLDAIKEKNGLAVLFHPGRYRGSNPEHYKLEWYLNLFEKYDHLTGIEVFNCGNRYPRDRILWDSLLMVTAPTRPIWGYSGDDMHSMRDFGRNWNVFLLVELDIKNVRQAFERGTFYFVYAPKGQDGSHPPVIESIKVNPRRGKIEIKASNVDSIIWISNGEKVGQGNLFLLKELSQGSNYVRAELYGTGYSIVCTQPFFIKTKNNFPKN